MAWLTPTTLRAQWSGCPANDDLCTRLLNAAREQVTTFAPALTEGAEIPDRYSLAQGMQARYIWERQRVNVGSEDAVGLEGYQPRVGSMDKATRDLLRPPQPPIGIG